MSVRKPKTIADYVPAARAPGLLKRIDFTCAAAKAETTVAHGLGYTPKVVIPFAKTEIMIWESKAADSTNVYLKGTANDAASVFVA